MNSLKSREQKMIRCNTIKRDWFMDRCWGYEQKTFGGMNAMQL